MKHSRPPETLCVSSIRRHVWRGIVYFALYVKVGGIKEKVLAAHRAGMKRVLLPKRNERDVKADLPENILKQIDLIYVSSLEDVLAQAFTGGNFKTSFDASDRRPKSKL